MVIETCIKYPGDRTRIRGTDLCARNGPTRTRWPLHGGHRNGERSGRQQQPGRRTGMMPVKDPYRTAHQDMTYNIYTGIRWLWPTTTAVKLLLHPNGRLCSFGNDRFVVYIYIISPRLSSGPPGVFYTCFYNHARRLRLEKLLYIELSRSLSGYFKPLTSGSRWRFK